jgi:hypothetical protein
MSLDFYGSSLQLYGGKRLNHGEYQISIDSVVYQTANGSLPEPGTFWETPLFSTNDLTTGYHTVKMTNLESRNFDLDFVCCSSHFRFGMLTRSVIVDYIPNFCWTSRRSSHRYNCAGHGPIVQVHPGTTVGYEPAQCWNVLWGIRTVRIISEQ